MIWSCDVVHPAVGAGGGYNERDGVEYINRDESDEEFDEVSTMCMYNGIVTLVMA